MSMNNRDTTVIICCAGMGTRLGIGTTKALVKVNEKSLIIHQLEQLKDFDDVRIVVGFQAERLIKEVLNCRKDVMFAFNSDYKSTGPLDSAQKAIIGAREYTIILGGDMFIHPADFKAFLDHEGQCISYTRIHSSEPIYIDIDANNHAVAFRRTSQGLEWSGLVKFKSRCFNSDNYFVHQMVEKLFPFPSIETRAIDIDTPEDYERVVAWVNSGYSDSYTLL